MTAANAAAPKSPFLKVDTAKERPPCAAVSPSIVKLAKAPKEVTRGICITTPLHLHSATVILTTLCRIRSIAYNVFFIQPAPLVWFAVRTLFALDPVPPFPLPMVNNDKHGASPKHAIRKRRGFPT